MRGFCNSLNNSLSVRYNPETDYIQIKSDGQWVNYKKVGLLGLIIFEDGVIYGGSFIQGSDKGMSYTTLNSNLVVSRPSSNYGTLLTNGMLNLSNYNKITIVVEKLDNISSGKLCVGLTKDTTAKDNSFVNKTNISTTGIHEIDVSSIDDSYYFVMGISGSTGSSITISKIIVE